MGRTRIGVEPSKAVVVRLPGEDFRRLDKRAVSLGTTIASLIREAVGYYFSVGADRAEAASAGAVEAVSGAAEVETYAPDTRRNAPLEDL